MKKVLKQNIVKLILSLLLGTSFLFITSCQNLFNGSELKGKIEEAIEYANAKSFKVKILPEKPEMGVVLGNSEREVKVSDEISLSFNNSDSYVFSNWTVFVNGEEDVNAEYVKIEELFEKNTKCKILKFSENIVIRPVCSEYLKVVEIYPDWGNVVPYDTRLTIKFNASLSSSAFRFSEEDLDELGFYKNTEDGKVLESYVKLYLDAENLCYAYERLDKPDSKTFKNISVKCEEENYAKYYGVPVVSGNNLVIPVNKENPFVFENNTIKNIFFVLDKKITSDFGIPMLADREFSYRINETSNAEKDNIPPISCDITASINKQSFEAENYFLNSTKEEFIIFNEDQILNNVIQNNDIFVKIYSKDLQSGIKNIYISETYIFDRNGDTIQNQKETETYLVPSENYDYSIDGLSVTAETVYSLKSTSEGAYLIKVWSEDFNHNKSEIQSFVVVTNRYLTIDEWKLYNNTGNFTVEDLSHFTLEAPKIKILGTTGFYPEFKLYYGESIDNIETLYNNNSIVKNGDNYEFILDNSYVSGIFEDKNVYLKVVAKDKHGREASFIAVVPMATRLIHKTNYRYGSDSNKGYNSYINNNHEVECYSPVYGMHFYIKGHEASPFDRNLKDPYIAFEVKYTGYWGSIYTKAESATYGSYYSSDNACIYTKETWHEFPNLQGNYITAPALVSMKDESRKDITFETKNIGTAEEFTIVNVKVSGRAFVSENNTKRYSVYTLRAGSYYVSFEGTEANILIPTEELKDITYTLFASDETLRRGSYDYPVEVDDSVTWYMPKQIEYNEDLSKLTLYNGANFSYKIENPDYSGNTIRLSLPENKVEFKNTAKLYYKKIDADTSYILDQNRVTLTVYTHSEVMNFMRGDPHYLIENKLLSLEEVRNFDSMDIDTSIEWYKEETNENGFKKYYLSPGKWAVPVQNLENGEYIMFLDLKTKDDKSIIGAFCYTKHASPHVINSSNIMISDETVEATLPIRFTEDYGTDGLKAEYARIEFDYLENNQWVTATGQELYNRESNLDPSSDITKTFTLPVKKEWMKVYLHEVKYGIKVPYFNCENGRVYEFNGVDNFYYHAPVYVYPNGTLTPDTECGMKNMIDGKALTIFCSEPTLVQTFYSPVNYGDKPEDLEKWEYYTSKEQVLNPVVLDSSKNYTVPSIPKGNYYIVIIRFCDGTLMNTEVKYSN